MLWEKLVTDGHVRSARLKRRIIPALTTSIFLTAAGAGGMTWAMTRDPPSKTLRDPASVAAAYQTQQFNDVIAKLRAPVIKDDDAQASTPNDISQNLTTYNKILNTTGKLPDRLAKLSPERFWSGDWGQSADGKAIEDAAVDDGDLKVVGSIVKAAPSFTSKDNVPATTSRWIAIMKRTGAGWQIVTLRGPGLYAPFGAATRAPEELPISLNKLSKG